MSAAPSPPGDATPSGLLPAPAAGATSEAVLAVMPVVRRELARQVGDPLLRDDLCQEVLARLLAASNRVDASTMAAYARVVTHNVVRSHERDERNRWRKLTRVAAQPQVAAGADEDAELADTEAAALQATLERLSTSDRQLLEETAASVASTNGGEGAAPVSLRVRLLRARARARVRYVLELRGVTLPTDRCLPVLDALAAGDRSRQRTVGVNAHLGDCAACASLAEEIVSRRRPLAVLVLLGGTAGLWRLLREHPAVSVAGASAAVAAGVAVAGLGGGSSPPAALPPPAPPVVTTPATTAATPSTVVSAPLRLADSSRGLLPVPADVASMAGAEVRAEGVVVRSVVGDEAIWIGSSDQDQMLVVLTRDEESPETLSAGQQVDFLGRLVANTPDTAAAAGVDDSEHLELLMRQGVHVQVGPGALSQR